MIRVELHDKVGVRPIVAMHPTFVDYELRESDTRTVDAVVDIAADNTIAKIVKSLDGKRCEEAYGYMKERAAVMLAVLPHREDGARALMLLLSWASRYPDARFSVSGGEGIVAGEDFLNPWLPRFSTRGVGVDWLGLETLPDTAHMDETTARETGSRLLATLTLDDSNQDIWGEALLQNANRARNKSSSSRSKAREKKKKLTIEQRNENTDASLRDDGISSVRMDVATVRLRPEDKQTLDEVPASGKRLILEEFARQIRAGRKIEELVANMGRIA